MTTTVLPLLLQVAQTSGVTPSPRSRTAHSGDLRYDPSLGRNRVLVGGAWTDVAAAARTPEGAASLTAMAVTMTDVTGGNGGYKVDD